MAPAFQTVAVSLVFLLWSACRRAQQAETPPPAPAETPGDERVEHRLDCLTVLARPISRPR